MPRKTIADIHRDLRAKKYSSVELTQDYLKRIAKLNDRYNCFVTVTEQAALKAAQAADKLLAQGQAQALTGIPVAQKDIFCTQEHKTSCGSRMLDPFIAPYDASIIHAFNQAGAVMLGKTNMDEFAMGSSNETSYYGHVKNPWQADCVPGGSSGGSAVAVAADLAACATGTDTGGSIRQPAAFCGITGLKPTYGRVSRYGMIAFASSLDQGGPMTLTAEDAALVLQVMAGFDPKDSTSIDEPVPDYSKSLNDSLKGLRIGLPRAFFSDDLDPRNAEIVQAALKVYERLGAKLIEVDLPHLSLSVPVYYIVAPAECSSNLARYDGVRFGHRCQAPKDLDDLYARSRGEGFGAEVKRRIMIGTYVLSSGYYDAYYLKAQQVRRLILDDFTRTFESVDVLAGPTTPTPAFKIGEKTSDPISMYLNDIFTIGANLAGLPAISIPIGCIQQLPVGLQLISPHFSEARLLNIAHRYQQETSWHRQEPQGIGE